MANFVPDGSGSIVEGRREAVCKKETFREGVKIPQRSPVWILSDGGRNVAGFGELQLRRLDQPAKQASLVLSSAF